MKSAVVIFVKTPGISPVKSRLAASIGTEKALEFYRYSCEAIRELCVQSTEEHSGVDVFWAVAEEEGLSHPLWSDFQKLPQGSGDLGKRLHFVHQQLNRKGYSRFAFLGGDCPQMTTDDFLDILSSLKDEKGFVVGPAEDGGFWVWGQSGVGKNFDFWLKVPYSTDHTCKSLCAQLIQLGGVKTLATYRDVDTLADLIHLEGELTGRSQLLPAQKTLCAWIKSHGFQQEK